MPAAPSRRTHVGKHFVLNLALLLQQDFVFVDIDFFRERRGDLSVEAVFPKTITGFHADSCKRLTHRARERSSGEARTNPRGSATGATTAATTGRRAEHLIAQISTSIGVFRQ